MGYTAEFFEQMFVGLRIRPNVTEDEVEYDNLVYLYALKEYDEHFTGFEEEEIEFVNVSGNVLHIRKYEVNKEEIDGKETITGDWTEEHFIPIDMIQAISMTDPAPYVLGHWKRAMKPD